MFFIPDPCSLPVKGYWVDKAWSSLLFDRHLLKLRQEVTKDRVKPKPVRVRHHYESGDTCPSCYIRPTHWSGGMCRRCYMRQYLRRYRVTHAVVHHR